MPFRLVSSGAPEGVVFLNGEWTRCEQQPTLSDRPHFTKPDQNGNDLHLYYSADTGSWQIASEVGAGLVFVAAQTLAHHPNTVPRQDWRIAKVVEDQISLVEHPDFDVATDGPNTELEPFQLDEIGRDFFLRMQMRTRKVVWFAAPTGEVYHSAAKPGGAGTTGGRAQPGKRYCHLCDKCFSANNFQTQHLSNCHRPSEPSEVSCVLEPTGGIRIWWKEPDNPPPGGEPEITSYQLRFSIDGGATWQIGIPATDSSQTSARVGSLASGVSYIFSVAAINLVGIGPTSQPSLPIVAGGPRSTISESDTSSYPSYPGTPASPASSSGLDFVSDSDSDTGTYRAKRPRDSEWSLISKPVPEEIRKKKNPKKPPFKIPLEETDQFMLNAAIDDDLAKTLENLLDETLADTPRLDGLQLPLIENLPNFSFGSIASFGKSESFALDQFDLDSMLSDNPLTVGPTYRRVAARDASSLKDSGSGWGKLRAVVRMIAKPKPQVNHTERLCQLLPRASPKLKRQLLSVKLLVRLKQLGHGRAANLILSHGMAANRDGEGNDTFDVDVNDDSLHCVRQEAEILKLAAPISSMPAPSCKPAMVRLPQPRALRTRSFYSWTALLSVAVAIWTPPAIEFFSSLYAAASQFLAFVL